MCRLVVWKNGTRPRFRHSNRKTLLFIIFVHNLRMASLTHKLEYSHRIKFSLKSSLRLILNRKICPSDFKSTPYSVYNCSTIENRICDEGGKNAPRSVPPLSLWPGTTSKYASRFPRARVISWRFLVFVRHSTVPSKAECWRPFGDPNTGPTMRVSVGPLGPLHHPPLLDIQDRDSTQ